VATYLSLSFLKLKYKRIIRLKTIRFNSINMLCDIKDGDCDIKVITGKNGVGESYELKVVAIDIMNCSLEAKNPFNC
jgi:hypothetical protein